MIRTRRSIQYQLLPHSGEIGYERENPKHAVVHLIISRRNSRLHTLASQWFSIILQDLYSKPSTKRLVYVNIMHASTWLDEVKINSPQWKWSPRNCQPWCHTPLHIWCSSTKHYIKMNRFLGRRDSRDHRSVPHSKFRSSMSYWSIRQYGEPFPAFQRNSLFGCELYKYKVWTSLKN